MKMDVTKTLEVLERMLQENYSTFQLHQNGEEIFVKVENIGLKAEYLKIQRKKVGGSQQRIEDGQVCFSVYSPFAQIANVQTFVQRFSDFMEEIALNKSEKGWSELYTKSLSQKMGYYNFMADLDSVYTSLDGDYVYGLCKNKGDSIRNIYVFFIVVQFFDPMKEKQAFGWPFLLKTKPAVKNNVARRHASI